MKKNLLWFPLVLLIAAAQAQTIQVDKNNRTIAVTTSDTATEVADIATVTVGFEIYAPDAQTAYSQGSQLSNAIMGAVKKAGVPEKDIQSKEQQLTHTEFPEYDKTPPEDRAKKQFTLSQSWTVRVPAKDAAAVLHVAIEAGGNESGAISWDVADRSTLQAKAAAKALVHARQIASQMAEGLGAKLGALVYASNQTPMQRVIMESAMASVRVPPPAPASLAVVPQNVEETATVYAVFAIE